MSAQEEEEEEGVVGKSSNLGGGVEKQVKDRKCKDDCGKKVTEM